MTDGRPRRRATTRIAYGVGAAFVLLIALAALAPVIIRGARFGTVVGWMLPPTRGTITVAGGRWGWGAVWALVRGRPGALSLDGVRVVDPEGIEVLRAAHITGAVELTRDHTRLVLHDLRVSDGAWRFATMKGARDVGFLAAFQSAARKAAARPRKAGGGLSAFVIADAELDQLDTTFDLPAWGLSLPRVHARGNLALGAGPPGDDPGLAASPQGPSAPAPAPAPRATFTFEVTDADLRGGGVLRILNGRARVELPFSAGKIARVATTAAAPDALQLQASDVATGRSRLSLAGSFTGIYGASRPRQPAGIDLRARVTDAADAIGAVWARRSPAIPGRLSVAGRGAALQLTFAGPLDRPTISASARGFDLGLRDLTFNGVGFDLTVQPATARARVAGLTFTSPDGGRLTLDAEVDSLLVRGALALDQFSTAPYLPGFLRPLVGGVLDGRLRGALDLVGRSASLDELALTLARPPGGGGPRRLRFTSAAPGDARAHPPTRARDQPPTATSAETLRISGARFAHGTLILPTVSGAFAGGQISARARIVLTDAAGRLRPPAFDIDVRARRVSVTRIAGTSFASGVLSASAHARGTLDALDVEIQVPADQTLRVFGEPCHLPESTVLRLDDQGLAIPDFRLRGADEGELAIAGRISRAGQLALTLDVRAFPLGKLPALAEAALPFSGQVSGRLRASGPAYAPRLEGEMAIERAAFRGRPLGGGRLTITPRPQGAIHGAGQVVEGVSLDGTLAPRGDGVHGVATLQLRDARLDPFLPISARAGGLKATGTVSGTIEARVDPGQPPSLDGRLTALAMAVSGPMQLVPRPGKRGSPMPSPTPVQTIELHAVSEVRLAARAGGGPVRVEPARFAGTLGTIELWGEAADGRAHAGARGRLLLAPAAPLALPWLSRVAGALDFEVAADTAPGRDVATPVVTGTVRIAAPVVFRLAGLPFDARVDSGEIRLADDGIARVDLPVTLGGGTLRLTGTMTAPPLTGAAPRVALDLAGELDAQLLALVAPGAVASAQGRARLEAHLEGRPERPALRARLRPGGVTLALRALPALPISIGSGTIDLDDHAVIVRDLHVGLGRGLPRGAGPGIDVIVGGAGDGDRDGDGAATLELGSTLDPRPTRVALPVRGQVNATTVAPVVIDDASFALRLDGDLSRSARLAGEITVVKAHVPRQRGKAPPSTSAPASPSPSSSPSWRSRPELARLALDIAARSRGGAVTVEVPHLPDVKVDVDYRVGGTAAKPQVTSHFEGADLWSSFALLLRRIFQ